jgi:hypothetical protein
MEVRDKNLKVDVLVCDRNCPNKDCYWPRPDPGSFTKGVGYKQRSNGSVGWLCGTRG